MRPPYEFAGRGVAPHRFSFDVAVLAVGCGILLAATGLVVAGMWLLSLPHGLGIAVKFLLGELATSLAFHPLKRLWEWLR
jgi:hypothetical protein